MHEYPPNNAVRPEPKQPPSVTAFAATYFRHFERRMPPNFPKMSSMREFFWHFSAGLTGGLGLWYLLWRWMQSLNPDALAFSVLVAGAETLAFLGTLLFFFDIWREGDTEQHLAPSTRCDAGLEGSGPIEVDIFLTTFDEDLDLLKASLRAANDVLVPDGVKLQTYVLDDGARLPVAQLAEEQGAQYLTRSSNEGFKAGNLRNGLFHSSGDFVVVLDADTRILPKFLLNTLGYFSDPDVAWVQTPHWFYDIPQGTGRQGARRLFRRRPKDPFMADPSVFFDVIQRRRNRNHASFCCGAGSIHRRDAIFTDALRQQGREVAKVESYLGQASLLRANSHARAVPLQPFRFHVSEDIYTSILVQSDPQKSWKSVYHPQAETRMLSPWSVEAWTAQRLKYAGGTFDIMFHANPLIKRGMPWRTKLHYAATFWSYLSIVWLTVLLVAPVFSLFTGIAPVQAYSAEFFARLLPLLIVAEVAMMLGCKGYSTTSGRLMTIGCLPIQWKALWLVLRGQKPRFPPTPKVPGLAGASKRLVPSIIMLSVIATAMLFGLVAVGMGWPGYTPSKVIVNIFWCGWNALAVWMVVRLLWWSPEAELAAATLENQ